MDEKPGPPRMATWEALIRTVGSLMKSFEPGKVSQSKATLKELSAKGWAVFKDAAQHIENGCNDPSDEDDSTALEAFNEFEGDERKVLWRMLDPKEQDYIKSLKE